LAKWFFKKCCDYSIDYIIYAGKKQLIFNFCNLCALPQTPVGFFVCALDEKRNAECPPASRPQGSLAEPSAVPCLFFFFAVRSRLCRLAAPFFASGISCEKIPEKPIIGGKCLTTGV